MKVGYNRAARTLKRRDGTARGPWNLGNSRGRQVWAQYPLGTAGTGRLGSLGHTSSGAGLCVLTSDRPSPRPRPFTPPEPWPRSAPQPGALVWAGRAPILRLVSAQPQGLRLNPACSPCPRAPGLRPWRRGVTQPGLGAGEGCDSLGLEIPTVQGLECRDEWGDECLRS